MKIKKISLLKYGPLEDRTYDIHPSFQCFTGPNESGKTLLIDAIIKLLIPRKTRSDYGAGLNRIQDPPHGLLMLDVNGKDTEFSNDNTPLESDVISFEDIRDILIVRNSDLEFLNQESCFDRATDKLLGLKSADIQLIIKNLKENGNLTSKTLEISSAGGEDSSGHQLSLAEPLQEAIKEYVRDENADSIARIELDILETADQLRSLKQKRDDLNKARDLQEYRKLEQACSAATTLLEELSIIPEDFTRKGEELLKEYSELSSSHQTDLERRSFLDKLLIILSFGSVLGVILSAVFQLGIIGIAQSLGVIIAFASVLLLRVSAEKRIRRFNNIGNEIELLLHSLFELKSGISDFHFELQSRLSSIEDKRKTLTEKLGILKSELSVEAIDSRDLIRRAQMELQRRHNDIDASIAIEFDYEELKEANEHIVEKDEKLSNLKKNNTSHLDKLTSFENRLNKLSFVKYLGRPCRYVPDSMDSLPLVSQELSDFISSIHSHADGCKKAIEIFLEMDDEEKEKVSELLQKSKAVEVFGRITDGRYTEISYTHDTREIHVQKNDGTSFGTLSLSKGTLDQLYLSIRVGLAEQIFGSSPGFFIMDDPFLASDSDRRKMQIDVLGEMLNSNWQIIYFTANQEFANELNSRFGGNTINLNPLR